MHGCKLGRDDCGRRDIIKTDDGQVFWNTKSVRPRNFQDPDCQPIARGQYGSGARFLSKEALRRESTPFFIGAHAFPDFYRNVALAGSENVEIPFNSPAWNLERDTFQPLFIDVPAVFVSSQLERHDR